MSKIVYSGKRDDRLIMLIGIPVVGFLLTFVMTERDFVFFTFEHLIHSVFSILVTAVNWSICRLIVIKLWNKYPWHLKPAKHILIELPVMLGFTMGLMYMAALLNGFFTDEIFDVRGYWRTTSIVIILVLFLTSFHEALFFYNQWKENFNKSLVLEKANIRAEYDTLKSQINPHFLFNSLNTLISLSDNNKVATKYIHNLSDFLRYTLDNGESEIKLLRDELSMVIKYIFLQKSRFGNQLITDIDIDEKYYHYTIPPMSLQMIVDNAIKHNTISETMPLSIKIYIEDETYIVVENNLQKRYEADSTKQGLQNIKNRYLFLSDKEVIVSEKNNKFTVKLPLVITEL